MNLISAISNFFSSWLDVLRVQAHVTVALLRFPTLKIQRPSVWRFDTWQAIELGKGVVVGPFTEIIVFSRTAKSRVLGRLVCGDHVFIGAGSNVRAAGGTITIGANSLIAQHVSIIASNHTISPLDNYRDLDWDQNKTSVHIGSNCWIGAHSVVLPGVSIGNNAVIGAASVVTKNVPESEIWLGVPARFHAKITPTA